MIHRPLLPAAFAVTLAAAPAASAWGAHGHRLITRVALEAAEGALPAWALTPESRERIVYQSNEADRFRATRLPTLQHENDADHYIDVDMLELYGLSLETISPLRHEYVRQFAGAAKERPLRPGDAPDELPANPAADFPGFALHAAAEHYAKLVSCFNTARILEGLGDANDAEALEQARANAVYHMGMLSHFVGDLAQPLHTTIHFNGWIGPDPNGYTREKTFHAFIDVGLLRLHAIDEAAVRPLVNPDASVNGADPWSDLVAHAQRSFERFETLYQLHASGDLEREPGRDLIAARLADGATTLAALYRGAWAASEPTDEQAANFLRYDDRPPPARR